MIPYFSDIEFAEKQWLWLFLLLPAMVAWYFWKQKKQEAELNFSSFMLFKGIKPSPRVRFRHSLFVLRVLALSLLITALARPQSKSSWKDTKTEGIDIVISMDVSLSMLAKDFNPNRLEVAKNVILDFIDARPNDRIGLVLFGGEAFTQCPLTTDHKVLKNMFPQIRAGMLNQGTAIGLGLANAVARIKDSKARSKVIIFISDGVNNVGEIAPLTAGDLAKTYDVRVYCIGVGTKGKALQPVAMYAEGQYEYDYVDVDVDEKVMTEISDRTGGKYFRATDEESLINIYHEIDKMEKTIVSERNFSKKAEHFLPFVIAAFLGLLLEFTLRYTFFKTVP
ncbi:MAG TPA: VWA domain-containing protein [Bacteroidia bacterium]|nr:VWA domain-containing protein [Bacteroidia bacterium]